MSTLNDAIMLQLQLDLDRDLRRISKRFKNPKITLVVRNPDIPDGRGDVVLTDDDTELAIAAIRKLYSSPDSRSLPLSPSVSGGSKSSTR